MPKHIGVIMDGNGRWAKKLGAERLKGHYKGRDTVRRIVEIAVELGLEYLTIYAFSTENWNRPKIEVMGLFKLILDSLLNEIDQLHKNNVNIHFIGTDENLKKSYLEKINKTCSKTWENKGLYFNVAMNYGGRKEIIDAVNSIITEVKNGNISAVDEKLISDYLYTSGQPDPDLIIRTSGEMRLSNFLVWQSAYSEFWFTDTLWPDFSKEDFIQAIIEFQNRHRRFGDIK